MPWSKLILGLALLQVIACSESSKQEDSDPTPYRLIYPTGFPEMEIPTDNPLTVEAVQLGKELFFDPVLSGDYSVSCASCHLPAHAFADTIAVSAGVHADELGRRNSYSLANVGYQKPCLWKEVCLVWNCKCLLL